MPSQKSIDWYFDFISPFAYFQHHRLLQLRQQRLDIAINPKPVLFAGLLKHYQHKGPAEIPSKRSMTYRYCHWYGKAHQIPFRTPYAHPFNPLPMLRLAIAHDNNIDIIDRLFRHIWVESADNPEFFSVDALSRITGFEDAVSQTARDDVKQQLKQNTEDAIARGVFGVPTIALGKQLFWGLDMTDMAVEYLDNPAVFEDKEYSRVADLPVAKARI